MPQYPMKLLVLSVFAAAIGTGTATAGSLPCCDCGVGCAPLIAVVPPATGPLYIVNQGPNYTGPGIVLVPGYVEVDTAPASYPYVGRDYYFPSYPYVRHHGGYYVGPERHHIHRAHAEWHGGHRVYVSKRRAVVRYGRHR